jgi:sec-independent protein translocase protein TatB
MFDIGWSELVVIGIVALVVIGPKELPGVLRTLGQGMTKIRRLASEFQGQFQEAIREAELSELKKEAEKLTEGVTSAGNLNPFENIGDELREAIEKPASQAAPGSESIGQGEVPPIAAAAPVVPPELQQPSSADSPSDPGQASSGGEMPPIAAAAPVVPPELEPKTRGPEPTTESPAEEGRKA